MSERKFDLHAVVFRLADLADGEKLDLIYAGITSDDLLQPQDILTVIVDGGNDDLADGNGDLLFVQICKEIQGGLHGATDVFTVLLFARVFDVEQNAVGFPEKRLDRFGQNASGGIETGVDSVLVAKRKDLTRKIRLQKRFSSRNGDSAFLAEIFTVTQNLGYDLLCGIFRSVGERPGVGVMTAFATQMTALEKYDEAYAGTVYRAEALKRMDTTPSAYMDSWKVRLITSL